MWQAPYLYFAKNNKYSVSTLDNSIWNNTFLKFLWSWEFVLIQITVQVREPWQAGSDVWTGAAPHTVKWNEAQRSTAGSRELWSLQNLIWHGWANSAALGLQITALPTARSNVTSSNSYWMLITACCEWQRNWVGSSNKLTFTDFPN